MCGVGRVLMKDRRTEMLPIILPGDLISTMHVDVWTGNNYGFGNWSGVSPTARVHT